MGWRKRALRSATSSAASQITRRSTRACSQTLSSAKRFGINGRAVMGKTLHNVFYAHNSLISFMIITIIMKTTPSESDWLTNFGRSPRCLRQLERVTRARGRPGHLCQDLPPERHARRT